jgi:hypothetical protein
MGILSRTPLICVMGLAANLVVFWLMLAISQHSEWKLTVEANDLKAYGSDLVSLCQGKSTDLRIVDQLDSLAKKIKNGEGDQICVKHIRKAVMDLNFITQKKTNACSMEKALELENYYEKYFRNSVEDGTTLEQQPKPLVRFAIAYGMRVSHVCRKHLFHEFVKEAEKRLTRDDFNELGDLISDKGPIGRLLAAVSPDEILLPRDLSSQLPSGKRFLLKLQAHIDKHGRLARLKEVCSKRFRPLYTNAVAPLAVLSRSGLEYKELTLLTGERLRKETKRKVALWSRIMFVCESLTLVSIDQDLPQTKPDGGDDYDESIKAQIYGPDDGTAYFDKTHTTTTSFGFEQLETYKPDVKIGDEIMGSFDYRLKTIVRWYDPKQSSDQRMKKKLLKRSFKVLSAIYKHDKLRKVVRSFFGLIRSKLSPGNERELKWMEDELPELVLEKEGSKVSKGLTKIFSMKKAIANGVVTALLRFFVVITISLLVLFSIEVDIDLMLGTSSDRGQIKW